MVWLASLIIGAVVVGVISYRYRISNKPLTWNELLVTAIGVGFISFSAYAAKNHIGPALLAPTPGTFDWYLIHDEDRAGKVVSCYLASPDVKPQMDCGPAEKAKAQVDRENSDRETEALLKRQ